MSRYKSDFDGEFKKRARRRAITFMSFIAVGAGLCFAEVVREGREIEATNATVAGVKAALTKRLLNNDPAVINVRAIQASGPFPYSKITCLQRTDTGEIACPNTAIDFSPK